MRQLTPIVTALAAWLLIGLGVMLTGGPLPPSQPGLSQPIDAVVLVLLSAAV